MKNSKTWITSAHQGFVEENMHSNTISAFALAAKKGADMIETDARTTKDGVLVCNHDADVKGFDEQGNPVVYTISETNADVITHVILAPKDPMGIQYVPTLEQALHLCYHAGMEINIDLKEGIQHAEEVAKLVQKMGMRGRTIYATNGAGVACIQKILAWDPHARFIDTIQNFNREALKSIPNYPAKCFVYTDNFSEENIRKIRESGCMLATISLNPNTIMDAFVHHPEMAEYPHTSDFEKLDAMVKMQNAY